MSEDNIRVLIVDDEDGVRTGMKKYLEDGNFYVDVAANGKEALTLLNQNKGGYDVALLDHLLVPKPNGIELMKIIKEKYPNIECIIMTGWGSDFLQRAIKAGAFRYIEKPFDSQELVMLIQFAAQQVRIQQISRDILSGISLHQVLSRVIATAKSLSMADFAVIRIFDKTINGFRTYSGDQGETINHVADEEALFHEIMSSGKTVSVPNIHIHENQIHHPVDPSMHSFLGVPIPGGEVHLGVLCVYHHEPEYFDTHETRTILKTLADQVGLVITKAMAFQEIRSHSRYMQALVKAAEGFAQAESTHDLAQLAWTFVKEQLCVSTFFIGLYDQTSRKLNLSSGL